MVQFRRLDPLANAGPYQRLIKSPIKSVSLAEDQFERLRERRPELIVEEAGMYVVGFPYRDYLEIHYGFADIQHFKDHLEELFNRCVAASSKAEAPRGVRLQFRDSPNRPAAEPILWALALDEGKQWIDMTWFAVPEMPEPGVTIAESFLVREATAKDRDVIAAMEASASGQPRLSEAGLTSLYENARWLRVVADRSGKPVAFVSLRREPNGWGVIEQVVASASVVEELREPLLRWTVAWLRNNGGRRIRKCVDFDDGDEVALLRKLGFVAGETGVYYTRPVDTADVEAKVAERKAHGWLITLGDWR
jgi:hypothetical protein